MSRGEWCEEFNGGSIEGEGEMGRGEWYEEHEFNEGSVDVHEAVSLLM